MTRAESPARLLIRDIAQLASPAGTEVPLRGDALSEVDVLEDAYVLCEGGRIAGATIVASRAGDLIATIAFVMQTGGTLAQLANAVVPYPTLSTSLRQAGDAYQRTKLTPAVRRALRYYFRLWPPRT